VRTPSEQVRASDELEAVFLPELGGRLHRLRAFGHDLLRTPPDPDEHRAAPFFWGAYAMAPWCNRIAPGRTDVDGVTVDLRPNFPDGSAIHGLVVNRPWTVNDDGTLRCVAGGSDEGWPWPFEVEVRPSVDGATLELGLLLRNRSDRPMPAGIGLHPWFVTPVEVGLPASQVYASNTDSRPDSQPVGGDLDLRTRRTPPPGLDGTWTGVGGPIELRWPLIGIEARLVATPRGPVAVASPREIGAVAIEPQTHGPDPLRRLLRGEPEPLVRLPPGDELTLAVRIEVARIGG
jgi:aldose 1-epimerase